MSAELLRKCAALMRERAEAADESRWIAAERTHGGWYGLQSQYFALGNIFDAANAEHIASWQPTVALKVADSLDQAAAVIEEAGSGPLAMAMRAIAEPLVEVADAYLLADAKADAR